MFRAYLLIIVSLLSCQESGCSEARTIREIVIDRLALDTDCDKSRVRIVGQSDLKRGSETAYRMEACGSFYICTSSYQRVECKPEAASKEPATPANLPATPP
jgi:hypothetical protein